MNISWSLHELANEANRIGHVGSSDPEVDENTNKLLIMCRLTLYGAGVCIQFKVSAERACHIFALSHLELV